MARVRLSWGDRLSKWVMRAWDSCRTVQQGTDLLCAGFGHGADPHEQRDEQQEGVVQQSHQAQPQGKGLADAGGHAGGGDVIHAQGQHRAQYASAIHGKGRQQVESRQEQVHHQQLLQHVALQQGREIQRHGMLQAQEQPDQPGDDHVDSRSRQCDQDFLFRVVGHFFQGGHATDGQQNDVTGLYAEVPGGEGMAQFVQHHAAEQGEYEDHALHDGLQVLFGTPVTQCDPQQQDEKSRMHIDGNPGEAAQTHGPFHGGLVLAVSVHEKSLLFQEVAQEGELVRRFFDALARRCARTVTGPGLDADEDGRRACLGRLQCSD